MCFTEYMDKHKKFDIVEHDRLPKPNIKPYNENESLKRAQQRYYARNKETSLDIIKCGTQVRSKV